MKKYNQLKTLLTAFFLCLILTNLYAQDKDPTDGKPWWACRDTTKFTPTGYVGVSYGFKYRYADEKSIPISIAIAMPIKHSNIGLEGKAGFSSDNLYYATSHFNNYYLLTGPYLTFQLNSHYSFDIRVLCGATYAVSPAQNYPGFANYREQSRGTSFDSTVVYNASPQARNVLLFVLQTGIGFRYMVSHKVGLVLNVDYTYRSPLHTTQYNTDVSAQVHYPGLMNVTGYYTENLPSFTSTYTDKNTEGFPYFSLGIYYQLGDAILKK